MTWWVGAEVAGVDHVTMSSVSLAGIRFSIVAFAGTDGRIQNTLVDCAW